MKQDSYKQSASPALMLGTAFLVLAGTLTAFSPFKANRRAKMAETISNGRQIKLILDCFAMDNDGVYPSDKSAQFYEIANKDKTSNGYFIQLFASGNTNSEKVFWIKGAQACTAEAPDDEINKGGQFLVKETLKAGDCGWAYMREQTNVDIPVRPILMDAYLPGTKKFDSKLHEAKVIVVFIDGSAKAIELDPKGRILNQGKDLLSPKNKIWEHSKESPVKLLAQPKLSKAAQQKVEAAAKAAKENAVEGKE